MEKEVKECRTSGDGRHQQKIKQGVYELTVTSEYAQGRPESILGLLNICYRYPEGLVFM